VEVVGRHVDVTTALDGAVGADQHEVVGGHVSEGHAVAPKPETVRSHSTSQ
jgi:hypothetical protein